MSSNTNTSLNRSQFVVNPHTGRPVKCGSRTFNTLVREGVLNQSIPNANLSKNKGKNIVATAPNATQAYRLKSQLEKERPPPPDKLYSIGRDRTSVVIKSKKTSSLKPSNIIPLMSQASINVNKKLLKDKQFMDKLNSVPENEITPDLRDHIEHLLLQELIYKDNAEKSNKIQQKNFNPINNKIVNNDSKTKFKLSTQQRQTPKTSKVGNRGYGGYGTTDYSSGFTSACQDTDDEENEDTGYSTYDE